MFIDRLDKILKTKKMTGAELAKRINLSSGAYSYWKKGKTPNAEQLEKISKELNVSVDWLLELSEDPIKETEIISFYRKSDERGKERIYKTAKDEAEASEKNKIKPFA